MSAEFDFDWGTSAARAPKAKKVVKEVKPKVDAIIVTQSTHHCKSKHKTYETFIKCALRKYNYNQVQKASLPQITVKGDGQWATVHESLSGFYASFSYDTDQDYLHQHQNLEGILFSTVETSAECQ